MIAPVIPRLFPDQRGHLQLEYLLLGDLLELIDEPATSRTRGAILLLLNVILDELSSVEESDGLSDVLDDRPQWRREVDAVRGDRFLHYLKLAELRKRIEENRPLPESSGDVGFAVRALMESLSQFQRRENRLVQMAVNRDIGGES